MCDGDASAAERLARHSLEICRAEHDEAGRLGAQVFIAWARYAAGDRAAGSRHMREALDANRSVGVGSVTANAHLGLAFDAAISRDTPAHRPKLVDSVAALEKVGGNVEEAI
jgi:hypothetical protein